MKNEGKIFSTSYNQWVQDRLERNYHHVSIWISAAKGIDSKLFKIDEAYIKFLLTDTLDKKLRHKKNECGLEVECTAFNKKV